jgi:hypothetical protein
MVRSTIRRTCASLALVGLAACSDNGPDCVPVVRAPTFVSFPVFAPGATVPFADAVLRQEFLQYDRAGCPVATSGTFLRFEPRVPIFVRFGYRLDYESDFTAWFYAGEVGLSGSLVPTNEVLVSRDPDPIEFGSFVLQFSYFLPL